MPMSKEERREYNRQRYLKKKEEILQKQKAYQLKNKEKKKEYYKQYALKNKERLKEYRKTESFKKTNRISQWKHKGILCFDYNLLYDIFLSTKNCEYCNINFTQDNSASARCLDHDHNITDKFNVRGVLCRKCNFKDVLRKEPPS